MSLSPKRLSLFVKVLPCYAVEVREVAKSSQTSRPPPLSSLLDHTSSSSSRSEETSEERKAQFAARVSIPPAITSLFDFKHIVWPPGMVAASTHNVCTYVQLTHSTTYCYWLWISSMDSPTHTYIKHSSQDLCQACVQLYCPGERKLLFCVAAGEEIPAVWVWSGGPDGDFGCGECGRWRGRLWRLSGQLLRLTP